MIRPHEGTWKPRKPKTMFVQPYVADGATKSGIVAQHDEKKMTQIALILAANEPDMYVPGDIVLHDEGAAEPFRTASGELISLLAERDIITLLNLERT